MSTVTIQLPPPSGTLSLTVGDSLYIDAKKDIEFCCSIGSNFSPDITSMQFDKDTSNGPYVAITAGSGNYNTNDKGQTCDPSAPNPRATAKSVQISNPPAAWHPK